MERRLAAILVADVVGYSRMTARDEAGTLAELWSRQKNLIQPKVAEYHGRVVKLMGDGVLMEFPSVVSAVQCAVDLQKETAAANAGLLADRRIELRIGVNLGDVVVENGDIYGEGVNVAARLEGLAEPGGICLSASVYDQVKKRLDLSFKDLGWQTVKNITEPLQVFGVEMSAAGVAGHRPEQRAPLELPSKPSIAVLPFENLSRDPKQDYFCDAITNDLITDLSRFLSLFVIASHSTFAYKGKATNVRQVGRELGVAYVLEGSVQKSGSRVRINAQLIDAATEGHLWAERYDRQLTELLDVQDEIVQTIVASLAARVDVFERERAVRRSTDNLVAYDCYLRGRDIWFRWTKDANRRAREMFHEAIKLDPGFARAYGYVSFTHVADWREGWDASPASLKLALEFAQKAVALDRFDYDNHWSLAIALVYTRQFDRGMEAYDRAVELNSNDANLLAEMADALCFVGRAEQAIGLIKRAMRLNPIYPDWYLWHLGWAYYLVGEYDKAYAALTSVSDPPNNLRRDLAATCVRLGRLEEARSVAAELLVRDPQYSLDRERMLPFEDSAPLERYLDDLRQAGLPD